MKLEGKFGEYGGVYAPELLVPALEQLEAAFLEAKEDPAFAEELGHLLETYAGRPTPVYRCRNIDADYASDIYLKREDLVHGGAHKTNQVLGQALLADRLGKSRLIAETGAGQHGVATAIVGALFEMETVIYMGARDAERQRPNVRRMELMGASVERVEVGRKTLKDAVNVAMQDFAATYDDTHYMLGTVAGPHPYPLMVREFQRVIGREARRQVQQAAGQLPDACFACVGGGSNAIGLFSDFLGDDVELVGVEPSGPEDSPKHGETLRQGNRGILHGSLSRLLMDADGMVAETTSIASGLDYPGIGPEHAHLQDTGRVAYEAVTDEEAAGAFRRLSAEEGIIPAIESSHALAYALKRAERTDAKEVLLVNLSGRGDKDIDRLELHEE
jgi:tryptophan synthase beta chain